MPELRPVENEFLSLITSVIAENVSNEQFGVSELADKMNMSRSNLLRKVKKETKLSVSQLISQVRLKHAMDLLRSSSFNVSEISHRVGFSSTSYFIKCFREYYGYPPGEVGKRDLEEPQAEPVALSPVIKTGRKWNLLILMATGFVIVTTAVLFIYYSVSPFRLSRLEKSIAVLPFKNDSNDSTNVYLINGLMEATLNNLQQIKDLKVISRTSAEKYRSTSKSIPEMAKELNVSYFVEGSGQKIGNKIVLNIQLIEAASDKHLWARQYRRQSSDIFELQQEIAKNIADEIQAIITPDEKKRIEKKPTENLEAYDSFLKGINLFYKGSNESLNKSIPYFKKSLELDNEFALAYAELAMVYYYLDAFQTEKKYEVEINSNADKALLFDSKMAESLVAKAMYYMTKKEYQQAVPYLEKALAYNPNSSLVIHFLSEVYNIYNPDAALYLKYALKGLQLDAASQDSSSASYTYLHVSNALVQSGFIDEALVYADKSLAFNPKNPFSGYLRVFVLFAKDKDVTMAKTRMLRELAKDTTRLDVMVAVGEVCFLDRDFKESYRHFSKFAEIRNEKKLDVLRNEDIKIGIAFRKMGQYVKAEEFFKTFKNYADNDKSIYKDMNLAIYYANVGDTEKALHHLELFSKKDNYQYWVLLLPNDPTADPIKDQPRFKKAMEDLGSKFWKRHDEIKETLKNQGLL